LTRDIIEYMIALKIRKKKEIRAVAVALSPNV
jgi:hypothetical protein